MIGVRTLFICKVCGRVKDALPEARYDAVTEKRAAWCHAYQDHGGGKRRMVRRDVAIDTLLAPPSNQGES